MLTRSRRGMPEVVDLATHSMSAGMVHWAWNLRARPKCQGRGRLHGHTRRWHMESSTRREAGHGVSRLCRGSGLHLSSELRQGVRRGAGGMRLMLRPRAGGGRARGTRLAEQMGLRWSGHSIPGSKLRCLHDKEFRGIVFNRCAICKEKWTGWQGGKTAGNEHAPCHSPLHPTIGGLRAVQYDLLMECSFVMGTECLMMYTMHSDNVLSLPNRWRSCKALNDRMCSLMQSRPGSLHSCIQYSPCRARGELHQVPDRGAGA